MSALHRPAKPVPTWAETTVTGGLLLAGAGLQVAAMFPPYPGRPATPITSTPYEMATYICLEVGWALAAGLVLSRLSVPGGIALAAGLAGVELGLLVADVATGLLVSDDSAPGIWLACAGWGAGVAGVLFGASATAMRAAPAPRGPSYWARAWLTVAVAGLAMAAFWPPWDHLRLVRSSGQAVNVTLGNAFLQPTGVMVGELMAGLAIGLVAVVAAFWSPPSVGAFATAGLVIALASQIVSGLVQVNEPLAQTFAGSTSGLNLAASGLWLTGYWTAEVVAALLLLALAVSAGWGAHRAARRPERVEGGLTEDVRWAHQSSEEDWPAAHRWPAS